MKEPAIRLEPHKMDVASIQGVAVLVIWTQKSVRYAIVALGIPGKNVAMENVMNAVQMLIANKKGIIVILRHIPAKKKFLNFPLA